LNPKKRAVVVRGNPARDAGTVVDSHDANKGRLRPVSHPEFLLESICGLSWFSLKYLVFLDGAFARQLNHRSECIQDFPW
jgi:hypothetical protein